MTCAHATSVSLHEWGNLTLNLCTWHCQEMFWTLTHDGLTIPVTEARATKIITETHHLCTECGHETDNPHSISLCKDCQIKELLHMLEDCEKADDEQVFKMPEPKVVARGRIMWDDPARP